MIDYIVHYRHNSGTMIWAKAKSFSKSDVRQVYEKQSFVRVVKSVFTIPELLHELTRKEIQL